MERLNGAFEWPVFLRFEYNGCYIYLGDYEVPVLSIKCQFFFTYRERTMLRRCFVMCFSDVYVDVFLGVYEGGKKLQLCRGVFYVYM